jgi:hypothetical protein
MSTSATRRQTIPGAVAVLGTVALVTTSGLSGDRLLNHAAVYDEGPSPRFRW